ncbi:MAG: polyprenyl synthetase family protein [Bacteroidales bacterium]|nr:polyprenyl synthetase family protein [Bacteroidales bacterium]
MTIETVKEYLSKHLEAVKGVMDSSLESDIPLLNGINNRIMESGGKHIRPMICLLIADSLGTVNRSTYNFAAASEMLHNATLLHDDVADDSPSRRGKPTIYSLFGAAASVLVGDFWLVKAMEAILRDEECSKEILNLFAKTLSHLAEGEMLQMQKAETLDTTFEDYLRIIFCKTASLFEASAKSGAISVGASAEAQNTVVEYARYLGYAFQMKDDIFDYIPSSNVGKEVGVDILEKKITLPLIVALNNAPEDDRTAIMDVISRIDAKPALRNRVVAFVERYEGVPGACKVLEEYIVKALSILESLPSSMAKESLIFLTKYVGDRTV